MLFHSFSNNYFLFMMPSSQELLIIGGILFILFGAGKIPQLMRGIGEGIREVKKGLQTDVSGTKNV